jgi:amidase
MTDVKIPNDVAGAFMPHNITEPILGSGSGPLAGKTFAVKDLYHIAGHKLSNGNPDYYDWVEPKTKTSVAVQQLLDAGADIVGITVCDEFFYSLSGDNAHYGAPKNRQARPRPWQPKCATSRLVPTRADRCGCPRPSAACTEYAPPTTG